MCVGGGGGIFGPKMGVFEIESELPPMVVVERKLDVYIELDTVQSFWSSYFRFFRLLCQKVGQKKSPPTTI